MIKKKYIVSLITAAIFVMAACLIGRYYLMQEEKHVKVGFVYVGDASNAYTDNFIKAQIAIEETYGDRVDIYPKYNIVEGEETAAFQELADEGCDIIFGTSYGYGETMKAFAEKYPDIEFCHATGNLANTAPIIPNYHSYMGHVYEGRYIAGVAAGMKLRELIDNGEIKPEEAIIGYIGAFPYAEVISGYTAFFLGVQSKCPESSMKVIYTNTWGDYTVEKQMTEKLLDEGCIVIGQHSDTKGPAVACENYDTEKPILHVSYNKSMIGVAPTRSLIGCRVNWSPYMVAAVGAELNNRKIESVFTRGITLNGTDAGAGIEQGWVSLLELNKLLAAEGTNEEIQRCIDGFKTNKINVFSGDYKGVNPYDPSDTVDLNTSYKENSKSSAPTFNYVIDGITIEE